MELSVLVVLIVFRTTNVLVHSLGGYLLKLQYKRGEDTALQFLLINLSVTEILQSALSLLLTPITDMVDVPPMTSHYIHKFQEYLGILLDTTVWLIHGANVIYIAVDRLLHVRLNLKYQLVCTKERSKYVIALSWFLCVLLYIVMVSLYTMDGFDYHSYLGYWYIVFDSILFLVAVYMYVCIFHIYVKSQRHPILNQVALSSTKTCKKASTHYMSRFQIFRNSRFYVVALRITNFIVLKVSADVLFFVLGVTSSSHDNVITHVPSMMIAFVMWGVSDTVDAYVYIFEEKSVRKLLRNLLLDGRARCTSQVRRIRRSTLRKSNDREIFRSSVTCDMPLHPDTD